MPQETEAQANDVKDGEGGNAAPDTAGGTPLESGSQEGEEAPEPTIKMLKPYQPSGRVTLLGILLMPILGAVGAYAGSWLYGLFAEYLCTLIVVFPLVVGGIAGAGVALGVRWGKIRNMGLAMLVGLAAGLFAFGLTYYWGYYNSIELVRSHLLKIEGIQLTEAEARALVEEIVMEDTNHAGIYGYFLFDVENSSYAVFRMGPTTFDAYEIEKSPAFINWGITIVNFLAAGVGGLFVGGTFAASPFCERDKRWYGFEIIFGSSLNSADDLLGLLLDGRYGDMLVLLEPPSTKDKFSVDIRFCPICRNGFLEGRVQLGKEDHLACRLEIGPEQLEGLLKLQKDGRAALKAKEEEQAKEAKMQEAAAKEAKADEAKAGEKM